MRNAVIKVALFSCTFALATTAGAQALSPQDLVLTEDPFSSTSRPLSVKESSDSTEKEEVEEESKPVELPAPKPPVQHVVAESETLTSIAEKYSVPWRRLFDKNLQLSNPDTLNISETITIPEVDEQLPERPVPAVAPITAVPQNTPSGTASHSRGSSAGNTYAPGYCTWYAKNRRPDLPNRMGNASAWVSSAAAQGFATGSSPRAGAIGQQGNHVVYVESVNADGTVTVSEMNYSGLFVVSSRTVSAGLFTYIY